MDREGLTITDGLAKVSTGSNESYADISPGVVALSPLLVGKPVKLVITDASIRKPRGVKSLDLYLIPLTAIGPPSSRILVALDNKGSCVVDMVIGVTGRDLYRIGLSWRLAKAVADTLMYVYSLRGCDNGHS